MGVKLVKSKDSDNMSLKDLKDCCEVEFDKVYIINENINKRLAEYRAQMDVAEFNEKAASFLVLAVFVLNIGLNIYLLFSLNNRLEEMEKLKNELLKTNLFEYELIKTDKIILKKDK